MTRRRLVVVGLLLAAAGAYLALDPGRFLNLDYLKSHWAPIDSWVRAQPLTAALAYFVAYVAITGLSLPGAGVMTLLGGAVFGLAWGFVLVSFASTLGATLAFLSARFVLRDWVQARFGDRLRALDAGIERDGGLYLFTLRLVPVFPFFVINLLMGLTPIRTWTFYWVSQLGMVAGTLVYVNAGTQLATIDTPAGILSPALLASFALLGVFPWLARQAVDLLSARRIQAGWPKPVRFDRNLIVIGGGSAGLVAAYIAAAVRARVTLIEAHRLGGDCLNTGCVPSKALIRSARLLSQIRRARDFGIRSAQAEFSFGEVMERVRGVIAAIEPHDSVERYTSLGVEVVEGTARVVSPWVVEVTGRDGARHRLSARSVVIAAGARPHVPAIPGIDEVGYLTSESVWDLRELPARLLVLGGGPIGCELAQTFARLGATVTQVESAAQLLPREDPEVSDLVVGRFRSEGITVLLEHRASAFVVENGEKLLLAEHHGSEQRIRFDALLVAVGRVANLAGYGLEELGIGGDRRIETNEFLQTRHPNIYAAGDVVGPYQFTHVAAHQAWTAAVNALFSPFRRFRVDYSVIPWATFVDPEVARVGINEREARERGIAYEQTTYRLDDLDRAIADGEAHGFVRVLTVPGKDRILGATIVGEHAGELIAEFVLAMRHGLGLNRILGTIHVYPTFAEASRYVAGNWKRAHAPQRVLAWVERFHSWRRR
ncbi:FAD-dependent oxidoreductase [Accumulibacter sp.]|uniref:FAD-dependent oxidoreductase n=1 Tax=Accumulibacter sp. TaxID=2053492 RepID=UPI0025D09564|nr:bifunctional TVP38/TMEM64 family protein/FAD-dependent oxidoreductase [Accumulibacter sp.]MCM8595978.1 FAD-dependent oxidoreductase [Accumulibacter sp.]MCM8627864.1 FAD-dependent oxidoreductase [Accumulibacter sp.]MDS4050127.1 FAD-dependent oxidoreductase [Accumulibacter sp.]